MARILTVFIDSTYFMDVSTDMKITLIGRFLKL